MKKILLIGMLALTTALSYGQCPIDAKRNNGNPGECTAQLTLIFDQEPLATEIDSIHVGSGRIAIILSLLDKVHVDGVWKLRYCLGGGNYPPIGLFRIWFRGNILNPCTVCFGCNPLPLPNTTIAAKRINKKEVGVTLAIGPNPVQRYVIEVSTDGGKTWVDREVIPGVTGTYYKVIKQ